ncbi:hypothetical protein MMPV_004711 [Pyropia vietnamensis]
MKEIPLPTDADLHAEAVALAPPPEWQVRSWEELGETLEGRRSGLKALRLAARAEAYRLAQRAAGRSREAAAAAPSPATANATATAATAAALVTMADHDALFLLAFLRHAKFNTAAACARLRRFVGFLENNPWSLSPDWKVLEETYGGRAGPISVVPTPSLSGERVLVLTLERTFRFTPTDMGNIVNHAIFWGLVCLLREPSAQLGGVCFVDDFATLGLWQLRLVGSEGNRNMWYMLQQILPLRLRGIHVCQQPIIFSLVWRVASTFITRKVRDRLRLYGQDTTKLVETIGAHGVPESAGGTAVVTTDRTLTAVLQGIEDTPWLPAAR